MKKINNKYIKHIKGYFDALDDISGKQREFTTKVAFISSESDDLLFYIKEFYSYLENPIIIKKRKYANSYGIGIFFKKLLLINPFLMLDVSNQKQKISENILNNYRDYVIFHLNDYINMSFEAEGVNWKSKKEIELFLLKDNKNKNCIVLSLYRENIKLFIFFFRKNYDNEEFSQWFDDLLDNKKIDEYIKERAQKKTYYDSVCENGLTIEENNEIFDPIVEKAIKIGYIDKEAKNTLLKYFSNEKIIELEKALFSK